MPAKRPPNQPPMSINMIIGANVRRLRKARGLTQLQLREELRPLGIRWNINTHSRAENGDKTMTANEIWSLARYFSVPVWSLFVAPAEIASEKVDDNGEVRYAYELIPEAVPLPHFLADDYQPHTYLLRLAAEVLMSEGRSETYEGIKEFFRLPETEIAGQVMEAVAGAASRGAA